MSQDAFPTPFDWMREMLTKMEGFGNDYGREFLKKPETVQAVQSAMAAGLTMQQARIEAMEKMLAAVEMPTRSEVEAIGQRLVRVEASLARIEEHLGIAGRTGPAQLRPTRNRRPPTRE